MTFRFDGFLDEIYASLVVRLHHTEPFDSTELWRNAADFRSATGRELGLCLVPQQDGTGEIEVHCEAGTPAAEQVLFARYVQDHLKARDANLQSLRTYICPKCSTPVGNREVALRRIRRGDTDIPCADCEFRIPLWDEVAQRLESDELRRQVQELREQAQIVLDNESKERLLVGEVYAIAARANQLAREKTISDHGIDMEIEFRDDDGHATGRMLFLQLKSGDSYLRKTGRGRIFDIPKARHAEYWASQAFPVMLVVRGSDGTIEWMEIRDLLRNQPTNQIVFEAERFDVPALLRMRDRVFRPS
jgi:DNA-directed RNA polymerase subunit RPC12/RpoP